jgi:hypothetical protein
MRDQCYSSPLVDVPTGMPPLASGYCHRPRHFGNPSRRSQDELAKTLDRKARSTRPRDLNKNNNLSIKQVWGLSAVRKAQYINLEDLTAQALQEIN